MKNYTLHNGYCANYECSGDDEIFDLKNGVVQQINGFKEGGNLQKTLYKTRELAQQNSCSYICTGDYKFIPGNGKNTKDRCAKCQRGTEVYANGELVGCSEIIDICKDPDRVYDIETGKCVALGNCLDGNKIRNSLPFGGVVGYEWINAREGYQLQQRSIKDFRPIGQPDKYRSCSNIDGLVEKHKCIFGCKENEGCSLNGYYGRICNDIRCDPFNGPYKYRYSPYIQGRYYSIKDNPTKDVLIAQQSTLSPNRNPYVEREFIQANSEEEFYAIAPDEGCYYRCPEERLCSVYGEFYNVCFETKEKKEEKCKPYDNYYEPGRPDIYACTDIDKKLYGYSNYVDYAYGQDREWQTYAEIGGFERNSSKGCLEGCTNRATEIKYNSEYNGETVSRRRCGDDSYFDYSQYNGGCKKCEKEWQHPDPNKNNWKDGNPINCVNKCENGRIYNQKCSNGSWCCIPIAVDAGKCPDGYETKPLNNGQIECYQKL